MMSSLLGSKAPLYSVQILYIFQRNIYNIQHYIFSNAVFGQFAISMQTANDSRADKEMVILVLEKYH